MRCGERRRRVLQQRLVFRYQLSPPEGGGEADGLGGVDQVGDGDDVVVNVYFGAAVLAAGDGAVDTLLGAQGALEALFVSGAPEPGDLKEDGGQFSPLRSATGPKVDIAVGHVLEAVVAGLNLHLEAWHRYCPQG